jgi:hypothetical protein
MNQEKPKVYTAEFREPAVKLANDSDKPVAQTARDIGVNEIPCIPGSANTADLLKMLRPCALTTLCMTN